MLNNRHFTRLAAVLSARLSAKYTDFGGVCPACQHFTALCRLRGKRATTGYVIPQRLHRFLRPLHGPKCEKCGGSLCGVVIEGRHDDGTWSWAS